VKKPARFEDEAAAEYRAAGHWYEERVGGLGIEFFDAVDATLDQIARLPKAARSSDACLSTCKCVEPQ
jgi:hypothetical protein